MRPDWFDSDARFTIVLSDLLVQPGLGQIPLAHYSAFGHLSNYSRFLDSQTAEESQLDNAARPLIDIGKFGQRIVDQGAFARVGFCLYTAHPKKKRKRNGSVLLSDRQRVER
jgi:hypothetical protein